MSDTPVLEPVDIMYSKPEQKPTDEPVTEAVQVPPTLENPADEPKEPEKVVEGEPAEESTSADEDESIQVLELDGEEYELDQVRTWKKGHMMQADYTKKTTTLAEERRTFETERESGRESLLKDQAEVSTMRDKLAVLVQEDTEIDWEDLKVSDPEEYIKLKERADKRKEALGEVQTQSVTPFDDPAYIAQEQGKLLKAMPEWVEDNQYTETYTQDTRAIMKYATNAGFSAEEFKFMTAAHHQITLLKAAKYDQLQEEGRKIKATRETVPLVTKPKAAKQTNQARSAVDIMYPPKTG